MLKTLPMLCAALLLHSPATAACTAKDLENGLTNYDGSIGGKYRIRLTLTIEQGHLAGVYVYATQLKGIPLNGSISAGHLTLNELDAEGKPTGRFEGDFSSQDCSTVSGTWHKIDSTDRLPFQLQLSDQTSGTLTHRYAIAGAQDDALINRNAQRFTEAVKKGDKPAVAALIDYPINVKLAGAAKSIRNSQELISQYDALFTPAYRSRIADGIPRNMFVRDQGIMLGGGEVWFGPNGKVKALNN
jgi:hypothetical protein